MRKKKLTWQRKLLCLQRICDLREQYFGINYFYTACVILLRKLPQGTNQLCVSQVPH
jgi:hypothetical protein